MGTSNWQNIPFCVDVLMKIAPERVLDVGVGFGRWGVLVREFCDVWYGRIFKENWKTEIHGIEGFPRNINDYHRSFYNEIHVGDATDLIPTLPGPWSVVVFGDVLEHFTKEVARGHLTTCLGMSDYILVNIPLGEDWEQGDAYGNALERHLSTWYEDDFLDFSLVRQCLFRDYIGRPFGSFVLSRTDPKKVRESIFTRAAADRSLAMVEPKIEELERVLSAAEAQAAELTVVSQRAAAQAQELVVAQTRAGQQTAELTQTRQRLSQQTTEMWTLKQSASTQSAELLTLRQRTNQQSAELKTVHQQASDWASELSYIKQHSTYRLGERIRSSTMWNTARWLKNRNDRVVTVRALGQRNQASQDSEVWLLRAEPNAGQAPVPWDFIETDRAWERRPAHDRPYGQCLHSMMGSARVPVDLDPHLEFLCHQWSGHVAISFRGRTEVIDLYSPESRVISVYPGRNPMLSTAPSVTDAAHVRQTGPTGDAVDGAEARLNGRGAWATGSSANLDAETDVISDDENAWIQRVQREKAQVIAVHCPRWLGVSSSTRGLFKHLYPVPATKAGDPYAISERALEHHADVLIATGVKHFVFSGGDKYQLRLIELLHRRAGGLRCDLFWHASYIQFVEDYTWELMKLWIDAARAGLVYSIAAAKMGQDRFFKSLGVRSAVLLNRVEGGVMDPPEIEGDERHIGIWLSGTTYRKIPHAMLSALAMLPDIRLHAAGVDPRSREVIEFLSIPTAMASEKQLPHDELMPAMRDTHATMYVTFVECCPMLPLESLAQGVPCLTGPNSHLFEDHEYLFSRLVVPSPDRAEVIADYLARAIDERKRIVSEYRAYHAGYEQRCRESVEAFMKL